jgi:presenilin-like A22 family membrane protease
MEKADFFIIIFIFSTTQLLGLYVASNYLLLISAGLASPVFENPEAVSNSLTFLLLILFSTAILLLVLKYFRILFKVLEAFVIFFASALTFDLIFLNLNFPIGIFLAAILTFLRFYKPSTLTLNLALIFSASSVAAVFGSSLGIIPSLFFLLFLSIYDFISVFISKHMLYLASEFSKEPTTFIAGRKIEPKKKVLKGKLALRLGAGDIIAPLIFSISALRSFGLLNALLSVIGSILSLSILLLLGTKKLVRPLPGLPFICSGTLAGFLLSLQI